jgi:hypothetical protein
MLGLLKRGEYSALGEAAKSLGYSRRQGQRWLSAYKDGGMQELLTSRVEEKTRTGGVGQRGGVLGAGGGDEGGRDSDPVAQEAHESSCSEGASTTAIRRASVGC